MKKLFIYFLLLIIGKINAEINQTQAASILKTVKELEKSAEHIEPLNDKINSLTTELNQKIVCLKNPSADCSKFGCSNKNNCVGTILNDINKLLHPIISKILLNEKNELTLLPILVKKLQEIFTTLEKQEYTQKLLDYVNPKTKSGAIIDLAKLTREYLNLIPILANNLSSSITLPENIKAENFGNINLESQTFKDLDLIPV